MRDVVILGGARTTIGAFMGALSEVPAPKLGGAAIKAALERAKLSPERVNEVYIGCVLPAGQGQAPARQAAHNAGVPRSVGAVTVNKVCGSGLQSVVFGRNAIQAGEADLVVAGGMESMSQAPYRCPRRARATGWATASSSTR
jgi:acetyl-CoA C-acetyltransferase